VWCREAGVGGFSVLPGVGGPCGARILRRHEVEVVGSPCPGVPPEGTGESSPPSGTRFSEEGERSDSYPNLVHGSFKARYAFSLL